MRSRCRFSFVLLLTAGLVVSCSSTPEQIVAKHAKRGDEYMEKEKYVEAVVEYRTAVKARPGDGKMHWKLARAALEAKDLRTAYAELKKVFEIDPSNHEAMGRLGAMHVVAGNVEEAAAIADNLVKNRPRDPEGYVLKSSIAIHSGRIDEAIGHLRKAVELDPGKIGPLLTLGNLHYLKHDRKTALGWYDKALAADPQAAEVHVARGGYFFASGEIGEGERAYRKAIELSKDKEGLRIALAQHYLIQGRTEDSDKELAGLIKELNSQKARKVLAEVKFDRGKIGDAREIVDAIVKENPNDLDGKYLKGRLALAETRLADAKALFGEVVRADPAMARARLFNGITESLLGQVEVGRKEIQEAINLDPDNVRAHLALGGLHMNSNAPAEAEREAIEVLRRDPSNGQAAVMYGDSFLLRKDYKKAEQIFGAMIRQAPKIPIGYLKMGYSKKLQNRPAEAASFFAQAVERSPNDLGAISEYAFALSAAGNSDKAMATIDGYIAKEPKNALLWEVAGRLNLASRRPAEAEKAFLRAIELAPGYSRAYYELGVLYVAQRKLADAESRFRKVVENNDKDPGAHTILGVVLGSQGKVEEANSHYRRALELDPKNALAANNLAASLSDHGGNLDEALKFAQIAREVLPDDPRVADTLGWIYFRKGLPDSAYPLIAESSAKLGKDASVRYHHGMVLAKKGKNREAAAELSAALALGGEFRWADEAKRTLTSLKQGAR